MASGPDHTDLRERKRRHCARLGAHRGGIRVATGVPLHPVPASL